MMNLARKHLWRRRVSRGEGRWGDKTSTAYFATLLGYPLGSVERCYSLPSKSSIQKCSRKLPSHPTPVDFNLRPSNPAPPPPYLSFCSSCAQPRGALCAALFSAWVDLVPGSSRGLPEVISYEINSRSVSRYALPTIVAQILELRISLTPSRDNRKNLFISVNTMNLYCRTSLISLGWVRHRWTR